MNGHTRNNRWRWQGCSLREFTFLSEWCIQYYGNNGRLLTLLRIVVVMGKKTTSNPSISEMSQYQYAAYRYSSVRISYTRRIRYQTIIDVVPACQCSTLSTTLFEKLRRFGLAYPSRYARPNHLKSPHFFEERYWASDVSGWIRKTKLYQFFIIQWNIDDCSYRIFCWIIDGAVDTRRTGIMTPLL